MGIMNEYSRKMMELKCQTCHCCGGSGRCNDAEAGDMYFQEWDCQYCNTTGLEPSPIVVKKRLAERDLYPCEDCGALRTKAEGGTTFTVCDKCWDKAYPKKERELVIGHNTKLCERCMGFHAGVSCEEHKAIKANEESR